MSDELDVEAMIKRFRERAAAVQNRNLPPIGGEERQMFLQQAQNDFQEKNFIVHIETPTGRENKS